MKSGKPHIEFTALDMERRWEGLPGYPYSIKQKVLAADSDETNKNPQPVPAREIQTRCRCDGTVRSR